MLNLVVSYDISDDRRRNKLAKVLLDYGNRVQYSVFEVVISPSQLEELKKRVSDLLEESQDNVRYYYFCANCMNKVEVQGVSDKAFAQESFIIV